MFTRFFKSEDGVATVDWVALSAGVLILAIAVLYGIMGTGAASTATSVNKTLITAGTAIDPGPAPGQADFN